MNTASYSIPAAPVLFEETIKKSRFITLLAHTPGRNTAQAFVQSVKAEHPDARHHCWAFIAGAPNDAQQWGFSDDGEPSGTAGNQFWLDWRGLALGKFALSWCVTMAVYGWGQVGWYGLMVAVLVALLR